jgi:ParB-like chromosome segregation protein Spo0J
MDLPGRIRPLPFTGGGSPALPGIFRRGTETDDGLLLADGHHRIAAALKEGRETVEAELRTGSRHDALAYAAYVGAAQRGLSPGEVKKHILRQQLMSPIE